MKDNDVITGMIMRLGRTVSIVSDDSPVIYNHAIIEPTPDNRYLFIFPADVKIPKSGIKNNKISCMSMGKRFTVKDYATRKHGGKPLYRWMICEEIKDYTSWRMK